MAKQFLLRRAKPAPESLIASPPHYPTAFKCIWPLLSGLCLRVDAALVQYSMSLHDVAGLISDEPT